MYDDDNITRDIINLKVDDRIEVIGSKEMEYMGFKRVIGIVKEITFKNQITFLCQQTGRLESVYYTDGTINKL